MKPKVIHYHITTSSQTNVYRWH